METTKILTRIFGRPAQKEETQRNRAAADYRAGEVIAGKYLIRDVKEGGLGKVFVVSEGLNRPFVLKTCKPDVDAHQFMAEARTWIGLGRHQYIVPAFWADHVAGMPCVAAEFIPADSLGRTNLRDHLGLSRPTLRQLVRWSAQFSDAMEYSHQRGLRAHRDIKPENILTTDHGDLQITDFGLSAAVTDFAQAPSSVSGTPAYMAPEQWLGQAQDFRTDLYSFGLVLYELSTGNLPWKARSIDELRRECLGSIAACKLPDDHPFAFVIGPMTMRDPVDRFPSPAVLRTALQMAARAVGMGLPSPPSPLDQHRDELLAEASLSAVGNVEKAFAAAKKLTELWPDFAPGWTQLGRLLLERGQIREAGFATQRSIDLDESRSAPWNNMGVIFHRAGHHQHAIEFFEKSLERDAGNVGAMINLAGPLSDMGRHADAIASLNRAAEIAPDKLAVWFNLGSILNSRGEAPRAFACFKRALECVSDNERSAVVAQIRKVAPAFHD